MYRPDGSEVVLQTEVEMNSYGFSIMQANMTATLNVSSDDESLYDHNFVIVTKSYLAEEPTWFDYTNTKIEFVKPPCEVSQSEIDSIAKNEIILLQAIRTLTKDE